MLGIKCDTNHPELGQTFVDHIKVLSTLQFFLKEIEIFD